MNKQLNNIIKIAAEPNKKEPGIWETITSLPGKAKDYYVQKEKAKMTNRALGSAGIGAGVGLSVTALAKALGAGWVPSSLFGVGSGLLAGLLSNKDFHDKFLK